MRIFLYSHAYSVLDVLNVNEHRLLQVRDPWGLSSWNGDWSDGSGKWTPELKRRLRNEKLNDGVVWISFDDFIR